MSSDVVRVLLLLKNIPKLGCKKINQILNKVVNITDILYYSYQQLLDLKLSHDQIMAILNPNWSYVDGQLKIAQDNNIDIISIYDDYYPRILKQIFDPPVILYIKGNKKILNAELFAIVGTRKPTIYGRQMADFFSKEMQSYGYIIVSGFALGIDITAHLAAIKKQHPTVAVLGTSLDCIYPDNHKKYVDQLIDNGGVLISENEFTTWPSPSCFPNRNRIISGLSRGVLVIEAARKSGSLITARCAMEQSREVFAVPGNINNMQALGCLDLIANGAKLVIEAKDIIEELCGIKIMYNKSEPEPKKVLDNNLNNVQQLLLNAISNGMVGFDDIVHSCKLTTQQVASQLMQLEIMGFIACLGGNYVISD